MSEESKGSGLTFRPIVRQLRERASAAYRAELEALSGGRRGGFTKKQVEDMCAGFSDGQSAMLRGLCEAGIVVVSEEG